MLASDLISGALRLIGVLASGDAPASSELSDGFAALQDLLNSWSAEELEIFGTRTAAISLVNGTQSYAIPGARPLKILAADTVVFNLSFEVQVIGPDGWAKFEDRFGSNARIKAVYCDYAFPAPAVLVAPLPNVGAILNLYCMVDLAALAASGDTFTMPEPYARAVRFNLAVDLAGEYGRPLPANVAQTAMETKAALKTLQASNRAGKSTLALPPVA